MINISVPNHVAIIMDGNGRWAKKRFVPKKLGHKAGAETLRKITTYAQDIGVNVMTVYAFSTENWKRAQDEIDDLMNLMREYIDAYIKEVDNNNVKIKIIGDPSKLDDDIQEKINILENKTKDKEGLVLNLAINYGGRDEITRAVRNIASDCINNKLDVEDISEDIIDKYLDTKHCSDPELIIRTSGEQRISNFLLWQMAYSELYYSDKLWPDFSIDDFDMAIKSLDKRERRFGGRI